MLRDRTASTLLAHTAPSPMLAPAFRSGLRRENTKGLLVHQKAHCASQHVQYRSPLQQAGHHRLPLVLLPMKVMLKHRRKRSKNYGYQPPFSASSKWAPASESGREFFPSSTSEREGDPGASKAHCGHNIALRVTFVTGGSPSTSASSIKLSRAERPPVRTEQSFRWRGIAAWDPDFSRVK